MSTNGLSRREQEILQWRDQAVANAVARFIYRNSKRFWYILVPLVSFFATNLFIFLAITAATVFLRRFQLQRLEAKRQEAYALAGGEEHFKSVVAYIAAWPDVADAVGLTQKAGQGPLGIGETTRRNIASLQYKLAEQAFGADKVETPELLTVLPSPLGYRHTIAMLHGQTIDSYIKAAEALAVVWRVKEVRVQVADPGEVYLTPVTIDPLAESIELAPDNFYVAQSVAEAPVGIQEDGEFWFHPLDQNMTMVGGVPGAGKSVWINDLLVSVAPRDDIQIAGVDMKGGLEFADFAPRMAAFADDQETALTITQDLLEVHKYRMENLRAAGFTSVARHGYSPEMPLIIFVIDEAAEVFSPMSNSKADKEIANELTSNLSRIVRLCRATGISVILATQKPGSDILPTVVRDNLSAKTCFRVTTPEAAVMILGDGARDAEFSPTAIGRDQKGVAVTADADGVFRRVRAFFVSESTRREIISAYAHLRRPLGSFKRPGDPGFVANVPDQPDGPVPCDLDGSHLADVLGFDPRPGIDFIPPTPDQEEV